MLGNEGLGRNKFLVFSRKGKPAAVWTGSTNWATTGLCTQMNDGILVEDPGLATEYRTQWKRLRDDHYINEKGKERLFDTKLMTANDQAKTGGGAAAGKWTLWFSRTSDERDLRAVIDVVNGLIVRGNEELARRCLVNIMGVYQHYRWRAYVLECRAAKKPVFENLREDDLWQKKHAEHDRELKFWLGGT